MRTHFLFKYFRPKIVLKIAYFRYLTYQGKQKMFFSVLHLLYGKKCRNLSRERGEISFTLILQLLWLRCFPGLPFQKHASPKRQETWKEVRTENPSLRASSFTQWSGVTSSALHRRMYHIQSTKYINCVH